MPYVIDDKTDRPFIEIIMSGRIDDDTLLRYVGEIFDCPGFQTKDQYVDWSDVTEYAVTMGGGWNAFPKS